MPPPPAAGTVLTGRYALGAVIGRGATATVWAATDLLDDAEVAVKWFRGRSPAQSVRARREVATLRVLQVPGVVALRDEGVHGGRAFVVMERVAGAPFPGAATPCEWRDVEGPTLSLLAALERVHGLGVLHRDLKPANVLVRDGRATLLDFGVARDPALDDERDELACTPDYAAPETLASEDDPRSDLYTVAVMVHRALTGRFPFPVRGPARERLRARQWEAPRPRWSLRPGTPPHVVAALDRMLCARPDERPASAREAMALLRPPSSALRGEGAERAGGAAVTEAALRARFVGPERLLHLPEDAARLLLRRVGPGVEAVERELAAWEAAGVARRVGDRYAVRREDLDGLLSPELASALPPPDAATRPWPPDLHPDARELAEWAALARDGASAATLARAAGWSPARVRRHLRALVERGAVERAADGRYAVGRGLALASHWSIGRRVEAHARMLSALPAGIPGRLVHALAGRRGADGLLAELLAATQRCAQRGQVAQAEGMLRDGMRALRGCADATDGHLEAAFARWLRVVLDHWTPRGLDRLAYELSRVAGRSPGLRALQGLVRAAQSRIHWTPGALATVRRVAVFVDPERELLRREVRLFAAQRHSTSALRAELTELSRSPVGDAPGARLLDAWRGHLAYAEGSFRDAARLHARAARDEPWVTRRCRALLNAAAAWMEVGDYDRAVGCADAARATAGSLRLAAIEGRAVWLLGSIEWRRGSDAPPDPEWVEAAWSVDPELGRLMAFNAAAFAWRRGETAVFCEVSARALAAEGAASEFLVRSLLDAMAADLGVRPMDDAALAERIAPLAARVPSIALQVVALARRGCDLGAEMRARLWGFARTVPAGGWHRRLDVLSVRECLQRLEIDKPRVGPDGD